MQVHQINQQLNNNNSNTKFTGVVDTAMSAAVNTLRFLDTNQAIGACAVDVGCMVLPRTITDFGRGPSAGFETLRRESSGTINHAFIGPVYGTLAGMLVASAVNSAYGIKAGNIFADSDAIDVLSKIQYDVIHNKNNINKEANLKEYCKQVASSIYVKGNPVKNEVSYTLNNKSIERFSKILEAELKKHDKNNINMLRNIILSDFGIEKNLLFKHGEREITADIDVLLKNITSLSPSFFKDKVVQSFKNALKFDDVKYVNAIKKYGNKRSILGLAIGAAIGCCIQPLNIYLTKKKTGSDGFVGVNGREKDTSAKFKALKTAAAGAFVAFALATIGKPKNLLKNLQYKSLIPTLNQFKFVYGLTIASRFLAARDKDELREAAIKDTIGFSSWLILGNVVSKYTLKLLDKSLLGKTRDEVLFTALKGKVDSIKDGKALSFREMLAHLPKGDSVTRGKLRAFNIAQLAGYAFSAIVLGVGIPKLNIYMTKRNEQKRAQERAMNPANNIMYKPENLAFLSGQMNFTSEFKN